MNILVIGSGGREHAIAYAVKQSPLCQKLVCAPGNPGMSSLGECIPVSVSDPKAIADLAEKEKIMLEAGKLKERSVAVVRERM